MNSRQLDLTHIIVAKTDTSGQSENYLPLSFHLRDTATVIVYLLHTWISPNMHSAMGISKKEMRTAALFLAYVHDIGKATNAFQYKIINFVPYAKEYMQQLGLTLIAPNSNEHTFSHHSIAGAAILSLLNAPSWAISIVGAHHGSTIESGTDFSDITDMYKSVFFGNESNAALWKTVWCGILDEALSESNCLELADLPQSVPVNAQLLLSGCLLWQTGSPAIQNFFHY